MQPQQNSDNSPVPDICAVAFHGASEEWINESCRRLLDRLRAFESNAGRPEVAEFIYFLSGGSEQNAIARLRHGTLNLLVADAGNNAWAAATEVKAYASLHGFKAVLIPAWEDHFLPELSEWMKVKSALDRLSGQRAGLIGQVSDWLVASTPEASLLRQRFGIELVELPFENEPPFLGMRADAQFEQVFSDNTIQKAELASVSTFLKGCQTRHNLSALSLQCFRMVKETGVTACLPVALMNFNGIPAGCEGDLVSLAGMMLLRELTGLVPWMANMVKVEHNSILLAHCTAPLQYARQHTILSHYETDLSAALQAEMDFETITLFRMNERLDKAFVAVGRVESRPKHAHACRTQIEVRLDEEDAGRLRSEPLGNHHLVLPGDFAQLLSKALQAKGIKHRQNHFSK